MLAIRCCLIAVLSASLVGAAPAAKRLNELSFEHEELREKAKLLHQVGESLMQKDWQSKILVAQHHPDHDSFTSYWRSRPVRASATYFKDERPFQDLTLSLVGKHRFEGELLTGLHVAGMQVPARGWAASVQFSITTSSDGTLRPDFSVRITKVTGEGAISFDLDSTHGTLLLNRQYCNGRAAESAHDKYQLYLQTPEHDLKKLLATFYHSPTAMRDALLADLNALRKLAEKEIESGMAIQYVDLRSASSDNPPMPTPASLSRPPRAETKAALLADIEKQISAREKIIREEYLEIHAAIQKALPLKSVLMELPLEPAPKK